MKKKPKMWTKSEFIQCDYVARFNKYHKSSIFVWGEILGDDWTSRSVTDDEMYEKYVSWYNKTYTKLGQALS